MKVTLDIKTSYETKRIDIEVELSIGRTEPSQLVLDDAGLSRVNTTFFVEGDELLLTDENSTNGTFLNGERISGRPRILHGGDEVRIGSGTVIRVEINDADRLSEPPAVAGGFEIENFGHGARKTEAPRINHERSLQTENSLVANTRSDALPLIPIAAGVMILLILAFGGVAFWIASQDNESPQNGTVSKTPPINPDSLIPIRVIDPLGGEDEEDLDDLIASWEVAEEEIVAESVADISVSTADAETAELNVTAAFLADRQRKALESRPGEKGIRPSGMDVPIELSRGGVTKQTAKLRDMKSRGYRQPLDFAELAEKRLNRGLIEMPMAKESFYLDVGGSASDAPFRSYSFRDGPTDILVGSPKYGILSQLAGSFAGQQYDLNNAAHRKQMRMRLLRMFNPKAKPILEELAGAYFKQFGRPLRVTSLTRSMDYQILLNSNNANSFKVRDENSLPPHTSGCAFDLSRKHMPVEEQNFVMRKLAEMEREKRLDALIEYGSNACFHVFIYDENGPPNM